MPEKSRTSHPRGCERNWQRTSHAPRWRHQISPSGSRSARRPPIRNNVAAMRFSPMIDPLAGGDKANVGRLLRSLCLASLRPAFLRHVRDSLPTCSGHPDGGAGPRLGGPARTADAWLRWLCRATLRRTTLARGLAASVTLPDVSVFRGMVKPAINNWCRNVIEQHRGDWKSHRSTDRLDR
jgi:hypothetical protein